MTKRTRTSPMDKAGEGLMLTGNAMTAMYNAIAQVLPETMNRVDRTLDLVERGVIALEKIADKKD